MTCGEGSQASKGQPLEALLLSALAPCRKLVDT